MNRFDKRKPVEGRKKPIKQFNRNGIRMISDRPERPKFFPGE